MTVSPFAFTVDTVPPPSPTAAGRSPAYSDSGVDRRRHHAASATSTSRARPIALLSIQLYSGAAGLGGAKADSDGPLVGDDHEPHRRHLQHRRRRARQRRQQERGLADASQITIDGTAPATPSAPTLDPSSDTPPAGDNTTTQSSPVVTGTAATDVSYARRLRRRHPGRHRDAGRLARLALHAAVAHRRRALDPGQGGRRRRQRLGPLVRAEPDDRHRERERPGRAVADLGHRRQRQRVARLERARPRTAARRSPATRSTAAPRAAARRCVATLGTVHELDGQRPHERDDLLLPGDRRERGRRGLALERALRHAGRARDRAGRPGARRRSPPATRSVSLSLERPVVERRLARSPATGSTAAPPAGGETLLTTLGNVTSLHRHERRATGRPTTTR